MKLMMNLSDFFLNRNVKFTQNSLNIANTFPKHKHILTALTKVCTKIFRKAIPEKTLHSELETDAKKFLFKLFVASCSG